MRSEVLLALSQPGAAAVEANLRVIISLRTDEPATALTLPALKQEVAEKQASVLADLAPAEFTVSRQYDAVPAIAGAVSAAGLAKLARHPDVASVEIDGKLEGTLGESVPLIDADDVHNGVAPAPPGGLTGAGVQVAVIDTGVYTGHADLSDGDILSEQCFLNIATTGPCPANGLSSCGGAGCAADDNGHGTHVTGIITSCGNVPLPCAGSPGLEGVAPDAEIHAYKVLNAASSGDFSDTLAALNHIIAARPDVDLINMSLGSTFGTYMPGNCDGYAIATAINILRARGTTTVIASGNDGMKFAMDFPACVSTAISVGMTYDVTWVSYGWGSVPCTDSPATVNTVACASNSDRSLDVVAPGVDIDSLSIVCSTCTTIMSGTSMATPHVVGVMALKLEQSPAFSPDQLEYCVESSGSASPVDPGNGIGRPLVMGRPSVPR